jgi:formate-dependent nitrite reductase membrane component NrfD
MTIEKQNSFGGLMAIDFYLGGAGAGIFLISYIMDLMNRFQNITKIGVVTGLILVLMGTLILFLDLGNKRGLYRLISNPSSWVTRGTCFITGFVIFGIVYSVFSWSLFGWILLDKTTLPGKVVGGIAAFFSFMTMLYTGMLFSTMKRIPLWNTPILPLLFISSSLYSAMAFLLLIGNLFVPTTMEDLHSLVMVEIFLILVQLIVLGVFLWAGNYSNMTTIESIRLLKKPLFHIWVITFGLIIPLLLLIYYNVANNGSILTVLLAALLLIEGGFFLRFYIIKAGIRLPLHAV